MPLNISRACPDALLSQAQIRFYSDGGAVRFQAIIPHVSSDGQAGSVVVDKPLTEAVSDGAITAAQRTGLLSLLSGMRSFYRTQASLDP